MQKSLWGEAFTIKKPSPKKVIKKASTPKPIVDTKKALNSRTIPLKDKLLIIKADVERILGVYAEQTQVITNIEDLHAYIDAAIENGEIAIDTETNNSLDALTCKLMGACIYSPGQKNAYIPVNHVDIDTLEKLPNQLTEADIKAEFSRLVNTKIIMHNAKFDYKVIKCTCGIALNIYYDTLLGAKVLDENERASLKEQYITKIDSSIEKYDIEHLFKGVEYAVVDPALFALYAATDSFMTYKLYKWQLDQLSIPDYQQLKDLLFNVEFPAIIPIAEMELTGIEIDQDFASRLAVKYEKKIDAINEQIAQELFKYSSQIATWRLTEEANIKPLSAKPNKDGIYTPQKSKSELLEDPPNLASPAQLAILVYDVLQQPIVNKKKPRGTGEEELEKMNFPICKLILELRGLRKLTNTYIEKLPKCVCEKTGRVHCNYNQYGAATGRLSSDAPNLQNIPSKEKAIRMMFKPANGSYNIQQENDHFIFNLWDKVPTDKGKVYAKDLSNDFQLQSSDGPMKISDVEIEGKHVFCYISMQEVPSCDGLCNS